MSARGFESVLARLYADREFLSRFLASPENALSETDLSAPERADLMAVDRAGLLMAARGFERKRQERCKPRA